VLELIFEAAQATVTGGVAPARTVPHQIERPVKWLKSFIRQLAGEAGAAGESIVKKYFRLQASSAVIVVGECRPVLGHKFLCAVLDEVAFFRDENFASPDTEVDAAISPGLARVPGSIKLLISSVHKRSGLLYLRYRDYFGRDNDDVLVVYGTTSQFNPSFDESIIEKALAEDPELRQIAKHLLIVEQPCTARGEYRQGIHVNGGTVKLGRLISRPSPRKRLDGPLRPVLVANNLGAPILPHERDNLGHNLARIEGRTPLVKSVEDYFTVTFPMGNSRRETIITPAAGIAPRNIVYIPGRRPDENPAIDRRIQ
jgi:hypothetical protein